MDSNDIDHSSASRRLLFETLLKNRIDAGRAASPPDAEPDASRWPQADSTRHDQDRVPDQGEFGRVGLDRARDPTERKTPVGPAQWLRDSILGHSLFKQALALLEKAAQAQRHQQDPAPDHPSPLICMRAEGGRTPFFCVHALLGSTFHYFALANLLDEDQPFYALQAPGLDGAQAALTRIGDFASCYIELIRQVQPKGPYKIGGYSFGGLVAFEIAQQLARAGEEVSRLIIFGTDVPIAVSNPKLFKVLEFFGRYAADFEQNLVMPFFSYEKRVNGADGSRKLPFSPVLARVAVAHCLAAIRYNPRPFSGRITLLETLEQQVLNPLDPSRGWDRLTAMDVQTMVVSGNHLSMLDEPHVRDLAKKLNWCLGQP